MFKPTRLIVLFISSLLITALLYLIDTDPPTDTFAQKAVMSAIVFVVVTILYSGIFGLVKEYNKRAHKTSA